ncbi:MAG: flagellar biosynthetic protein FliO [Pseudohongiellaceae bacterium]
MNASAADSGTTLATLAMLGKTAAVLAVIVALILLGSYLLKRLTAGRLPDNRRLRVISSVGVGQRERVVIVQIHETWLVLGVGGGQVNRLHEMPAPEDALDGGPDKPEAQPGSFARHFGEALKRSHNSGISRNHND